MNSHPVTSYPLAAVPAQAMLVILPRVDNSIEQGDIEGNLRE
jgi:hypothetical protein